MVGMIMDGKFMVGGVILGELDLIGDLDGCFERLSDGTLLGPEECFSEGDADGV